MAKVRVIGDVHEQYDGYLELIKDSEYSVQVGDMGFDYAPISHLDKNHVFVRGNHDNTFTRCKNMLPDYGVSNIGGLEFFHVGGGHSVDWKHRVPGINYFLDEELSQKKMNECLSFYENLNPKPEVIISHECPYVVSQQFDTTILESFGYHKDWRSDTCSMLNIIYHARAPKLWVFGHHHKRVTKLINGTMFVGLNILDYVDLETDDEYYELGGW